MYAGALSGCRGPFLGYDEAKHIPLGRLCCATDAGTTAVPHHHYPVRDGEHMVKIVTDDN